MVFNDIHETTVYLEKFIRNLLLGENNELKNRYLHINHLFDENADKKAEINSGVGLRMIGNTGQYVKEFTNVMKFADEIEAYEYIERHGLEKISSVRKL